MLRWMRRPRDSDSAFCCAKPSGLRRGDAIGAAGGGPGGIAGDTRHGLHRGVIIPNVYRLRGDQLEQLTRDHSLTQALLEAGTISAEEAKTHRYKNVLYRYLGTKEGGTGAEAKVLDAEAGDRFLICSDGVTDGIKYDLDQLTRLIKMDDPQAACSAIVKAAEDGGSKDNITCIVVHCA